MAEPLQVPGLAPGGDYSTAVRRRDGVVQLTGLNGTRDGVAPESPTEQAHLIVDQLETVLDAAGLSLSDVFSLRMYAVSHDAVHSWIQVRAGRFAAPWPVSTVLLVERLYDPTWQLELEALAEPAGI